MENFFRDLYSTVTLSLYSYEAHLKIEPVNQLSQMVRYVVSLPNSHGTYKIESLITESTMTRKRYQLTLHAENLPNMGTGCFLRRVSSPYARVEVTDGPYKGTILGTTEIIPRTLNPHWTTTLFLEFRLRVDHVPLKLTVYDDPASSISKQREAYRDLNAEHMLVNGSAARAVEVMGDHIVMGEATFEASSVFGNPGNMDSQSIGPSSRNCGT